MKTFPKVTSPLGSCAAMRWGSNPHARTTILRQSIFVDCRIFFCFSEHLSIFKNLSHHERVTSAVSFASTNSAVLSLSGWLPPYAQRNKVLSAGCRCGASRSRTADRPVRHPRWAGTAPGTLWHKPIGASSNQDCGYKFQQGHRVRWSKLKWPFAFL